MFKAKLAKFLLTDPMPIHGSLTTCRIVYNANRIEEGATVYVIQFLW